MLRDSNAGRGWTLSASKFAFKFACTFQHEPELTPRKLAQVRMRQASEELMDSLGGFATRKGRLSF